MAYAITTPYARGASRDTPDASPHRLSWHSFCNIQSDWPPSIRMVAPSAIVLFNPFLLPIDLHVDFPGDRSKCVSSLHAAGIRP
jgi:hypothetical protein